MTSPQPAPRKPQRAVFPARGTYPEARRIGALLRKETIGGGLLVVMAAAGIVWANTPWAESYFALRDFSVGIEAWNLKLSLGAWAADGLLAVFFFLVGLELKREFVAGDLRRFSSAVVPVAAAAGGVMVPALVYVAVVGPNADLLRGWAIPTATDIAFAVAVLAVIGSHLPSQLRISLLTPAVVDDLIAISIIAVFYTESIRVAPLLFALVAVAVYAGLAHRYRQGFRLRAPAAWLVLLPIGVVVWVGVHASGIHATSAGVILGFAVPVRGRGGAEGPGLAEIS